MCLRHGKAVLSDRGDDERVTYRPTRSLGAAMAKMTKVYALRRRARASTSRYRREPGVLTAYHTDYQRKRCSREIDVMCQGRIGGQD